MNRPASVRHRRPGPRRSAPTPLRRLPWLLLALHYLTPAGPAAAQAAAIDPDEAVSVVGRRRADPTQHPAGQTVYAATSATVSDTPALTVADLLIQVPGVTAINGNGPRDVSLSIRGSNDHMAFGIRNIQLLEDGFPLTQPDGRARADLIDPHAYAGADVFEGPDSSVFGDYAIEGALDLHTRTGAAIDGIEAGGDFGSFSTVNAHAAVGASGRGYDFALFGSDVRGDTWLPNTRYDTSTENARLTVDLEPGDRLVFKVINNVTDTGQSVRLSLNQYAANPFQAGCANAAAPGCGTLSLFRNGISGSTVAVSPQQAGLGRFDRRSVTGLRWEHEAGERTTIRTQFTYDSLSIDQPNTATSTRGPFTSYDVSTSLDRHDVLFGRSLDTLAGLDFGYLDFGTRFYNLGPAGGGTLGALTQTQYGHQWNLGAHLQETVRLDPRWSAVLGLGGTYSDIGAVQDSFGNTVLTRAITANRFFFELAPEASVIYAPRQDLSLHGRVATAYGTPQPASLFVTPQGTFGNNTTLEAQTNLGLDLGATWTVGQILSLQPTGYYEFYRNEQITQSAGAGLQSFTFNAPASQHRGVELTATLTPLPDRLPGTDLQVSYLYDNQVYTDFTEVLANSRTSRAFDRKGNAIPGVIPNFLDARLNYRQPTGPLRGLGGFLELVWRDAYALDNADLVRAAGYELVNLALSYDPPFRLAADRHLHLYIEIQNLFDRTTIGSASNIADSLTAAGAEAGAGALRSVTGSVFAGSPRAVFGGLTVRF